MVIQDSLDYDPQVQGGNIRRVVDFHQNGSDKNELQDCWDQVRSLASKVSQSENFEIDKTMGYFTRRFKKFASEQGGFMNKETNDCATSSSDVCYKCDQPGHSMRDCPMHKAHCEKVKDKERDQVHPKISRREPPFLAVKRDMTAWEDYSSDSDDSEHSNAFMAKSNKKDAYEKVLFKGKLEYSSSTKLRKLALVLLKLIKKVED